MPKKKRRRPSGGPVFPFTFQVSSAEDVSKSRSLIIPDSRNLRRAYDKENSKGHLSSPFIYYSEALGNHFMDRKIFRIEEKGDHWRVVSAWTAEGFGKLPAFLRIFKTYPDVFEGLSYNALYRMDPVVDFFSRIFGLEHMDNDRSHKDSG